MTSEKGTTVNLYIYDLTHGFASLLAPAILGQPLEGVWHTAVVLYDREFFYGGGGITSCAPGGTQLGAPHRVERLGETFVPFQVFVDYIEGLSTTSYTPAAYNLLEHNCNHFSDEVAQFLCGARVPKYILHQPEQLLGPQQRAALQTVLADLLPAAAADSQMMYANGARHARQDSPDYLTLNNQIEEARLQSQELEQRRSTLAEKLARKDRKKEKKRKKLQCGAGEVHDPEMAEAVEVAAGAAPEELTLAGPSSAALQLEADERREEEQRKRLRDPPIVYKDIDGALEIDKLCEALERVELPAEAQQSLTELRQYLVQGEGSWVLGDDFLAFIGWLLSNGALSVEARVRTLRCLAAAALRDDVSLVLHQDRRHHALLSYAHRVDLLDVEEQRALALFMCNLFENISSSEWLLYISEWDADGQQLSNIRVTTKVCVHAALSADAELREVGTALMHNVATKEVKTVVFDEVCVELAMALLQLLQYSPSEEHLYRACKALARLVAHSQEVPQLVAMVGPDPAAFRGTSPRVDEQIDLIMQKVK